MGSNFITDTRDFPLMFAVYFVNCKKGIKNDSPLAAMSKVLKTRDTMNWRGWIFDTPHCLHFGEKLVLKTLKKKKTQKAKYSKVINN